MALNIAYAERISLGNKLMWAAQVTGDGSSNTVKVALGRLEQAWTGNISEAAGYNPQISFAGTVLSYGLPPTIGASHYLYVIGYD